MHALIVGSRNVGKTTLIRRVLKELDLPVFGFETKKEEHLADEQGDPVYIYEAGSVHIQSEENLVGRCKNQRSAPIIAAFDRFAAKLTVPVPEGSIIEMDEIGFMESRSEAFCDAIMSLLDGEAPIIAAVKDKENPFLNKVRSHPNARCFYITQENRDRLYTEILEFMKSQLDR